MNSTTIFQNQIVDSSNGPYKSVLVAMSLIFGTLGTALSSYMIFLISKKPKPLHNDTILSLITIIVGLLGSIFHIARGIMMQWPYNIFVYSVNACSVEYATASLFNSICVYPITLLSLERMLLIIFKIKLSKIIWIVGVVVLMSIHAALMLIVSVQKTFLFSDIAMGCISSPYSNMKFVSRFLAITYIISFLLVTINYSSIIVFQLKRTYQIKLQLQVNMKLVRRQNLKILFRAMLIVLCFTIAYLGKVWCWTYQWVTGDDRPWTLNYISNLLFLTHNVSNCLIVLYLDSKSCQLAYNHFRKLINRY
ncbi:hypothetical protein CONCODRAFT_4265 [Conidiobolus coronatus NRRL 28638]|uniref:G-protein coupled receptors family 1 profile domain-containing protein n=1 Tax=Conidiobolus coronatus (strain ATCC 28846 / CBS 209.66 / NRRL 28638) TaxID=796925 RepID=A0A137PD25_CONC2|nr:hypothetical protein CONCODRAFT_4265 [Conidiobolus coronatus NRRL 28638]|eukprot:KXN72872.1 hypothetical protein CONCODRAFT_4265 [Conidiobolus coronatus NRRL 28638]